MTKFLHKVFQFFLVIMCFFVVGSVVAAGECKPKGTFGDLWYCPTDFYWECSLPGIDKSTLKGTNQCCKSEEDARQLGLACSNYSNITAKEGCVDRIGVIDVGKCPNGYGFQCDIHGANKCCINEEEALKIRLPCINYTNKNNCVIDKPSGLIHETSDAIFAQQGETYCNSGAVYQCNGAAGVNKVQDCVGDTVCVENESNTGIKSAECRTRDELGTTCGDPDGSGDNRKCCCIDANSAVTQVFEHDQTANLNIAGLIAQKIKNVSNGMLKGNDKLLQVENACMSGSWPNDTDKVCTNDCYCVYSSEEQANSKCTGVPGSTEYIACVSQYKMADMCTQYLSTANEYNRCTDCFIFQKGYWSALGCMHFDSFGGLIQDNIMPLAIGFSGTAALLCIIYSAIMMQTSAGNAEKVKKAQQNLTACITGLILIIFSVFILRFLGASILKIPGFK